MIRFEFFAAHLGQSFEQRTQVARAPSRSQSLLYAAPVRQHGHAIARVQCDLRYRERRCDGVIELAESENSCAQQSPGIEDEPDRLAALDLVRLADQFAAARAGGPADVAQFIGFAVFA